mgnify:CR=1 FL=1
MWNVDAFFFSNMGQKIKAVVRALFYFVAGLLLVGGIAAEIYGLSMLLDGGENSEGAADRLAQAVKALARGARYSAAAEQLENRMRELSLLAADLSGDLADELSRLDYSPEKLEQTELITDLEARLEREKKRKSGSFTPLWVRIVAIGSAVVMIGTAVPLTLIFLR